MQISCSRILVVDDEPNILMSVEAILGQEGYEVDSCANGLSALDAIRKRSYDLVLTDLKMPGIDGLAVLAEVRKRSPNTVTVMMTGYGSVDSAIEAVQLGAYEYLLKPVGVPELKAAVRRALERKRLSEIDTLYGISRTLTTSFDSATIGSEVCDAANRVLTVANVRLLSLARDGSAIQCGKKEARPDGLGFQDPFCAPAAFSKLQSGEIVTSDNADDDTHKWAEHHGVSAFALLPGIVGGRLVCVLCADNGPMPYDFHASALRFLQALASQTAMALENASLVTELKNNNLEIAAANQKLRDLDKLKFQLLGVATHELRTPLSVILGYNSMLAESLADRLNDHERETLRESMAACRRLIGLVNSMLDITQIESGKMRLKFATADLGEMVRGVASLLHYEAERKKITLKTAVPNNLPKARLDAERMQQVLVNLVANALKFTDAGGSIRITAGVQPDNASLYISVSDTGIGIAPQFHAAVFDEFSQIKRDGSVRRRGSGLGLAIARKIVEAHKGSIQVHSRVGQGSTFTVTLPLRAGRSVVKAAMSA